MRQQRWNGKWPKIALYISTDGYAFFSKYSKKAMQLFYIINDELKMYNQL